MEYVTQHRYFHLLIALLLAVTTVVLVRNAWLGSDAYISFRTVDNFVNGYGLTWNVAERVQTFTHPLWVMLVSSLYAVTGDIYYTVIYLSLGLSLLAILWLIFKVATSQTGAVLALLLMLFSKAFVDYTTSGLENPLAYVLTVLFFYVFLRSGTGRRTVFLLSLLAALGTLNRLDYGLLFAPATVVALLRYRRWKGLLYWLLGFIPLIAWEAFCLVYYGFPFPNTFYAKLSTGVPQSYYFRKGAAYFLNSISVDPLTLITIGFGVALSVRRPRHPTTTAAVVGLALYLIYVARIGGCFMSGRFFATPFLIAVILISRYRLPALKRPSALATVAAIVVVGLLSPNPPPLSGAGYRGSMNWRGTGISDERGFYYPKTGLLLARWGEPMPHHGRVQQALALRSGGPQVIRANTVGFLGFFAGPQVYIVDCLGLCDPLIARLPVTGEFPLRIGHFRRRLPDGYLETLKSGENRFADANLAEYYQKLSLITRGHIFSTQRFRTILDMNLGRYDYLIQSSRHQADGAGSPADTSSTDGGPVEY